MKIRLMIPIVGLLLCISCKEDKFRISKNASELLTNNSSKTWKLAKRYNDSYRMNMGDCFLSYRVTYSSNGKTTDNNVLNDNCGESMDADWSFYSNENGDYIKLKGEKVKRLLKIDNDYKFFKILALTDSSLVVSFKHKQFANTERTITDYLVPEDVTVKDRNYHN